MTVIKVSDPHYSRESAHPTKYKVDRVGHVGLNYTRTAHSDVETGTYWSYEVSYDLYEIGGTTVLGSGTIKIEYDASAKEGKVRTMKRHTAMPAELELRVNAPPVVTGTVPDDIVLTLGLESTIHAYIEAPNYETTPVVIDYNDKGDYLELYWTYYEGAEYYEVEWMWLDSAVSSVPMDYMEQAVRAETYDQYYELPKVYAAGTLYLRVRPVGVFINDVGTDYTITKAGKWSDQVTYLIENGDVFERNKTWQYAASFAEGGKRKSTVAFYDGTLRGRQSLTQLSTDRTVGISETKFDYEGREALKVIPSAIGGTALNYVPNFNVNNSGNAYGKADFDQGSGAAPLDSTSGASKYYSNNNSLGGHNSDYIARAGGFPFAHSRFMRDGTGRPAASGGVGPAHQLGSGKETKYHYG